MAQIPKGRLDVKGVLINQYVDTCALYFFKYTSKKSSNQMDQDLAQLFVNKKV